MHYKFGGSTAGRTVACPSWVNLSKNMPGGKASQAAIEGTLMHLLFERGLNDEEFEPASLVGDKMTVEGTVVTITATMIEKVYTALDCQCDLEEEYQFDEVQAEVIMNTDDETGGTADIIAWSTNMVSTDYFAVGDLKTGDGYMVYAKDNEQLLFYAWQAVEKYKKELNFTDGTTFLLYIIQPSDRRDDPVDIWETDLKTILKFGKEFKHAQKMAKAGIKEPCPGGHCKYCPAEPTCPAKTGLVSLARRIPQESTELKDLATAMHIVDDMESWCRAVRKTAHDHLDGGGKLKGFKLVAKRASRVWNNEAEALKKFKNARGLTAEDYLNQELKSAPQMEKVCKSKGIDFKKYESMISLHSSGTTLVKDKDKRPEVLSLARLAEMSSQLKT